MKLTVALLNEIITTLTTRELTINGIVNSCQQREFTVENIC